MALALVMVGGGVTAAESQSDRAHPEKPHWSLLPLERPRLGGNAVELKARHPIDVFVELKRSSRGLVGTAAADPRTLVRRLSFGLTGLPPTPEDVESLAAEGGADRFEALVDRLLASPRHGEHWARHWLDAVHYADTHGNDHDYARWNAWPYRDYVIRAFNEDKPYRRFVQEQVAGDALFPEDPQGTVALGFLAAGPWDETLMVGVREDTVDHRMAQVLDRDDMVSTVMSTFLGLTAHCARCHNHKFDPISQKEYYQLQAVFAGVDRADLPVDMDPAVHGRRRELLARRSALLARDPVVMSEVGGVGMRERRMEFARKLAARNQVWEPLEVISVTSATGVATRFERETDGSWFVTGVRPDTDTFVITARTRARDIRAFRLEALPDDRLPGHGPGRYEPSGNFHLSEFRAEAQPSTGVKQGAIRLEFARAVADHADGGDVVANARDGRRETYWSVHPRYGEAHEAVFELKEPAGFEEGTTLILRLEFDGKSGHQLGRFRLSLATGSVPAEQRDPAPASLLALLRKIEANPLLGDEVEFAIQRALLNVERELAVLPEPQWVYGVGRDFVPKGSFKPTRTPRPIHVLGRGELSKPGELVGPGALSCIPGLGGELTVENPERESDRRVALARWLTDDRNVLFWRTIVNRVWSHHFGRGLCDTPNDFGRMGGTPSHPELLDWLAVWFRDDARGSLKALHRLIVTSETYKQAAIHRADGDRLDGDNRWLWRMNRLRLSAEQVRDSLLHFSGQLDLTMGGPAVVQFLDKGKATFMPDGGAPAWIDYENFPPDASQNRRRSIYRFVFRTLPDPFMEALDAPDGGALVPVRNESTTAPQAFALLNNPFVIRQCEHIASRLGREGTAESAVSRGIRLILQREPTVRERERLGAYARGHGLANAIQLLINGNEFLYLD